MKNKIICSSCAKENSFYRYTCTNCKSFLRDKVYNIDLWNIIGLLIESPAKAFKQIIFADHKNFIFFIWILISAKLLVNTRFVSLISIGEYSPTTNLFISYVLTLAGSILYFILFSFVSNLINKMINVDTRFRDTLAVISYSFLPYVAGILFVFILELVVFGGYLFSVNPTPFEIKGLIAYFFSAAELILIAWSVFLSLSAFKAQTNSWLYSITITGVFYLLLTVIIYFASKVLFVL